MLPLGENTCEEIKGYIERKYPEKWCHYECRKGTHGKNRYFNISTPIEDFFYQYWLGKIYIDHDLGNEDDEIIVLKKLRDEFPTGSLLHGRSLKWMSEVGMKQCYLYVDEDLNSVEEICNFFDLFIETFDPILEEIKRDNEFDNTEEIENLGYSIDESLEQENSLDSVVKKIGELKFDEFSIPAYQRPYKWTSRNVNQLISDLKTFQFQKSYRLGSLVLHNNEIVDGQQRIVTLSLILKFLLDKISSNIKLKIEKQHPGFINGLNNFCEKIHFQNPYSLYNVVENVNTIAAREDDLDDDTLFFILQKCEFVVFRLADISEAFQFFDSQNARGKDLEAHDLLKAFHLREMESLSKEDELNIDNWQKQKTAELRDLFLVLYRAKRWSLGKHARSFKKDDVSVFKGITLSEDQRYPFYQMEIIAHVYVQKYMHAPDRIADRCYLEYPFNLDDQQINGSRFFDMVRHYSELYRKVRDIKSYSHFEKAKGILSCMENYKGCERTGDKYVQSMFYTLLLYYVDRFSFEEMDKVVAKFFVWAYYIRFENYSVQLATIDNYSIAENSMFRVVHDAKTPYDIINLSQNPYKSSEIRCSQCDEIKKMFKQLKKMQE